MAELVALILALAIAAALLTQGDTFSPAKMFLASFALFHLGAWTVPRHAELWMLVLVVLLVGATAVALEALSPASARLAPRPVAAPVARGGAFARWIWLLSLPAILGQLFVIDMFGGLVGYINMLGNRVIEFRGLGWVRTLTAMLLVFNLVYMAVGLVERRGRTWWLGYWLHLLLLLTVGLLSGSRSGLLTVFAMQLMILHYLRRPVSIMRGITVAAILVAGASVLGVVREAIKVDEGRLVTGVTDGRVFQGAAFVYGIEALDILVRTDTRELALGGTFFSLLTNPVPRSLWPNKPDTGGVMFTKRYTGDAWGGASNLTPTFLGEWVINFDWVAGIALFALTYTALLAIVVAMYWRLRERLERPASRATAVDLVRYICVMWAVVALMVGEVTNVVLGLVLTQVLPLALMRRMFSRSVQPATQR